MKYKPSIYCGHANESPATRPCDCYVDCACRESMCLNLSKATREPVTAIAPASESFSGWEVITRNGINLPGFDLMGAEVKEGLGVLLYWRRT